jgi:hypothetical protein
VRGARTSAGEGRLDACFFWAMAMRTELYRKEPFGVDSLGVEARELSSSFLFFRNGTSLSEPDSVARG